MTTTLTLKGQVTIPKQIRDAMQLTPGVQIDFAINREGQVVLKKASTRPTHPRDRFEAARGKADIKWRTHDLMKLLREDA